EFIIEGKRLNWEQGRYEFCYDAKGNYDPNDVYSLVKFVVSNVYKGDKSLIGDTVVIVEKRGVIEKQSEIIDLGGGTYGGTNPLLIISWADGDSHVGFHTIDDYSRVTKDEGLYISSDYSSILFCKKSDFPENPDTTKNYSNYFKLKLLRNKERASLKTGQNGWGPTHPGWGKITGLTGLSFNSREEFYEYMKQFDKITIPIPQTELQRIKNEEKRQEFETLMKKKYEVAKKNTEERKKKDLSNNATRSNNNLTILIKNQTVNYNSTNAKYYFEFDFFAYANNNSTYLDNVLIKLNYNIQAFGSNLVSNNKITTTVSSYFNSNTYETAPFLNDETSSCVKLGINVYNTVNPSRTQITTSEIKLFHVKIELPNNVSNKNSNLQFTDIAFTKLFSWFTPASNSENIEVEIYDDTYYNNPASVIVNTLVLHPSITGFSPTTIHAGTGDILTITGNNFGTQRGRVLFSPVNSDTLVANGLTFLENLDEQYYVSWSNTEIKVIVPSCVIDGYSINKPSEGAGTGKIKIKTATNDSIISSSSQILTVDYSIINQKHGTFPITRMHLARLTCDYDFVFTLHTTLQNNTSAKRAIEAAIRAWNSITGLKLALEKNSSGAYVYATSFSTTGKSVIGFDDLLPSGMETKNGYFWEATGSNIKICLYNGSYIRIANYPDATSTWDYDTINTVLANKGSFYNFILHEIGHIILVGHVNQTSDLMYYKENINVNNPIKILTSSLNPVKGVINTKLASQNIPWSTPNIATLGTAGLPKPIIGPATIGGSTSICNGNPVNLATLNLFLYSGLSYQWSTGATSSSISVSTPNTSYTVTVSNAMCTKASDPKVVGSSTLSATFNIITPGNCYNNNNGSIETTVTGSEPPFTFNWQYPIQISETGQESWQTSTAQNIYNLSPGNYLLTLRDNNGCRVIYSEALFAFRAKIMNVSITTDAACNATAIVFGGYSPYTYQWYENYITISGNYQNPISTAQTISIPCLPQYQNYHYSLVITDACGTQVTKNVPCCTPSKSTQQNEDSDFVEEIEIYPNPTTGIFTISNIENATITVFNSLMKEILVKQNADNFTEIDLSNSPTGIYFVRIIDGEEVVLKKVEV
ncbi:MAG: T9SS type A sorting domain-containing protein, partial [Bacteroidales bacterium]|nr:T9SS type A sorting domain-containing protein [Bacteroidales bacterium]